MPSDAIDRFQWLSSTKRVYRARLLVLAIVSHEPIKLLSQIELPSHTTSNNPHMSNTMNMTCTMHAMPRDRDTRVMTLPPRDSPLAPAPLPSRMPFECRRVREVDGVVRRSRIWPSHRAMMFESTHSTTQSKVLTQEEGR